MVGGSEEARIKFFPQPPSLLFSPVWDGTPGGGLVWPADAEDVFCHGMIWYAVVWWLWYGLVWEGLYGEWWGGSKHLGRWPGGAALMKASQPAASTHNSIRTHRVSHIIIS